MSTVEVDSVEVLTTLSDALAAAVEQVAPSVVKVEARQRRSQGTGVIWTADGLVVTADHVLERGEEISVTLHNGKSVPATIVGRDGDRDVGLLRIAEDNLPSIAIGESPKVGHLVLAVGRPNDRLMATIGLVNALKGAGRKRSPNAGTALIQTDALLYPGFSGGPLLDAAGRMVGLNSTRSKSGAGMAVALESVTDAATTLLAGGKVRRGYIGVVTQVVSLPQPLREKLNVDQTGALLISSVEQGSPAEEAGLMIGDVLLGVDGQTLQDGGDLRVILNPDRVGERLPAHVIRGGELRHLDVTIGERL